MKKRELKAKIAELEQSVHTWKAAFLDTSKELTRVQMALQIIPRPVERNSGAITGQPSVTVTVVAKERKPQ